MNLVSLSRVQESVTFQTLECCSCLDAQLKHTNWGKVGRGRKKEEAERGKGWRDAWKVSYCHWGRGFTLLETFEK